MTAHQQDLQDRRITCIRVWLQGNTSPQDLCRQFNVSRSGLYFWIRRYHSSGWEGLQARKSPGRSRKLSPEQEEQIQLWLLEGAKNCGFHSEGWTLNRIRDMIGERCHIWYHPAQVSRILRRWGWTCHLR